MLHFHMISQEHEYFIQYIIHHLHPLYNLTNPLNLESSINQFSRMLFNIHNYFHLQFKVKVICIMAHYLN